MSDIAELAAFLDEMVARATDDDTPVRTPPEVSAPPPAAPHRSIAYRAARKAYRTALKPQLDINNELRNEITAVQGEHAALRVELAGIRAAIAGIELSVTRLGDVAEQLAASLTKLGVPPQTTAEERLDRMYADFEDAFRGSSEMITERLRVYVHDLLPRPQSHAPVLDIGSGRGEWLSVLKAHGIGAYGVDISSEFVEACIAAGLDARLSDAFVHLHAVPSGTLSAVSAFHMVEHLPIQRLVEFVDETIRVLEPGGKLILETPNPTNVSVGAAAFYRDPTHVRPVHPEFLKFLLEHCGYESVIVRYLHPIDEIPEDDAEDLSVLAEHARWALRGPQDYALIATKPIE
jgi:O-antigen chain-terminating methyltransferase